MPDFRGRVESYTLSGELAMVACAHLCGAPRGHRALKAFARRFTQAQRRVLGVRRDPKTVPLSFPEQSHFWTGVARRWIRSGWKPRCWTGKRQVRGPAPPGQLLAADGKELRHAQGAQVVTLTHPAGQYYRGSQLVETKSNEIPAVRQLLERVTVAGSLIGIDALHTQQETARQVVQEAGADYLLTVKANQKNCARRWLQSAAQTGAAFFPRQSRCRRSGRTRGHRRIGAATKSARSCATVINPEQACFPGAAQCAIILRQG